jgi:hypothetical protein
MMSLYEMTAEYRHLMAMDVDDQESVDRWNHALEMLTGQIDIKVTNIALLVKQLQAEERALADEIGRLQDKWQARQNKIEWLKRYMLEAMQLANITKTTDVRAEVRLQANPPSVNIVDEKAIPADYWLPQEPKLDKAGIRDMLKEGRPIPGAELVQTVGVRIK